MSRCRVPRCCTHESFRTGCAEHTTASGLLKTKRDLGVDAELLVVGWEAEGGRWEVGRRPRFLLSSVACESYRQRAAAAPLLSRAYKVSPTTAINHVRSPLHVGSPPSVFVTLSRLRAGLRRGLGDGERKSAAPRLLVYTPPLLLPLSVIPSTARHGGAARCPTSTAQYDVESRGGRGAADGTRWHHRLTPCTTLRRVQGSI